MNSNNEKHEMVRVLGHYVATDLGSRSLRSDRAVCMLGLYVLIELGLSAVRLSCSSSSMASRICVRCLGTIYIDSVVTDFDPNMCKLAGFLKTLEYWQRDKFWDLVSGCLILCLEMLETSALGLGQDLGLLPVLEGAMTNSTYVSRFSFILIHTDLKSAIGSRLIRLRYYPCVGCMRVISTRWLKDVSVYDCLVPPLLAFLGGKGKRKLQENILKQTRTNNFTVKAYSEMFPRWDGDLEDEKADNIVKAMFSSGWAWEQIHWLLVGRKLWTNVKVEIHPMKTEAGQMVRSKKAVSPSRTESEAESRKKARMSRCENTLKSQSRMIKGLTAKMGAVEKIVREGWKEDQTKAGSSTDVPEANKSDGDKAKED
ncbi:hypothetical protein DY000_02018044 [Brassica cretica]|uniref:Uncharacterized protein n=1 Tax=Brassica cretica TaxID=69181 RepID=A0ABQ7D1S3_BRACR|nr:hypothetical protein DY000_02018044 [Brassica cretica]